MTQVTDQLPKSECLRKLASVQTVASVTRHPLADRLEIVRFKESLWQAVVAQHLHKVGDEVVVFEADTVLPKHLQDMWMMPARVKSFKIRAVMSQVCVLGLPLVSSYVGSDARDVVDLDSALGITKYQPPVSHKLAGDIAKDSEDLFALELVPKTKQLRLQTYPELYDVVCKSEWYATLKLDGTSMSVAYYNGKAMVAGRNNWLTDEANAYYRCAKRTGLFTKLTSFGASICLQGELMGPKIAGNQLDLPETELYVFRIWDIDRQRPYSYGEMLALCYEFGIKTAPVLFTASADDYSIEDLIKYANELTLNNGKTAEGIVVNSDDNTSSFKVISDAYKH